MYSTMTKTIARTKLASAIKSRDKRTVKAIMDWASCNLSPKAFAIMFVKDIERFPAQDKEWFNETFMLVFSDPSTGKAYMVA